MTRRKSSPTRAVAPGRAVLILAIVVVPACGAVRAPAPASSPPLRLLLADPRTDAVAAANTYADLFPLAAAASAAIDSDSVAVRCVHLAMTGTAGALWALVHHEFGHYRVADRLGGNPHIDFSDWLTEYRFPPGLVLSAQDELELAGAGVGQSALAAETMYRDWAWSGSCSSHQALGLGMAAIDLTRYAAKTLLRGPSEDGDDVVDYVDESGGSLTVHEVLWTSALANVASAPLWSAALAQVGFAADGVRSVAMPTIAIGELECAAPWFCMRLARSGPIASMTTVLGTNHVHPLRVELDVGTHESIGSLGAALLGLPLGSLELAPFARGSLGTEEGPGIAFGVEAELPLGRGCGTGMELSYRHADLRSEFDGSFDGIAIRVWVEFAL